MKPAISALLLCIIFANCKSPSVARMGLPPAQYPDTIRAVDFDFKSISFTGFQPIPYDSADYWFDNYRDKMKRRAERGTLSFSRSRPKVCKQSRYMWIAYPEMKNFIAALDMLQKEIDKKPEKYGGVKVSGVRIYLSVYEKDYKIPKHQNKLSAIFCGTYLKDGKHVDITDMSTGKRLLLATYSNHTHLCPPDICPGASLDETITIIDDK